MGSNSLYNHKAIGPLPVIPNGELKKLAERIAGGDFEAIHAAKAKYSFEEHQKQLINAMWRIAKTKKFKVNKS